MPITKWIRRFLLRLIKDPPFLLALLFICVTICPFVILGLFIEAPNWMYWIENFYFILKSDLTKYGIGVYLAVIMGNFVKPALAEVLTTLQQNLFSAQSMFDTFLWDIENALDQDMGKAIGANYARLIRKEQDAVEKKEKLQKGPYDEQKELTRRFYDGRMKYFGYQNYLKFLIKNWEELSKRLSDSVSEEYPAGDPLLIEEITLARMILRKEVKMLDEQMEAGTWD